MFENVAQQNLADWIKAHLLRTPTPADRYVALDTLKGFERARWVPRFFDQAVNEIAPERVSVDGRKLDYKGTTGAARRDLVQIMKRYLELLETNTPQEKPLSYLEGVR